MKWRRVASQREQKYLKRRPCSFSFVGIGSIPNSRHADIDGTTNNCLTEKERLRERKGRYPLRLCEVSIKTKGGRRRRRIQCRTLLVHWYAMEPCKGIMTCATYKRSTALQHISKYKMALFPTEMDREVNLVECSGDRRFSVRAWLPFRKSSKNTERLFPNGHRRSQGALTESKILKNSYHKVNGIDQRRINKVSNSSVLRE